MERTIAQFGDIFRHNEKEYVLLAQTDLVYAALILSEELTRMTQQISDQIETGGSSSNRTRRNSVAYSFVILETEEFKGRGAHFAKTDNQGHQTTTFEIIGSINHEDRLRIRNEILSENRAVPEQLVDIVKSLNIT